MGPAIRSEGYLDPEDLQLLASAGGSTSYHQKSIAWTHADQVVPHLASLGSDLFLQRPVRGHLELVVSQEPRSGRTDVQAGASSKASPTRSGHACPTTKEERSTAQASSRLERGKSGGRGSSSRPLWPLPLEEHRVRKSLGRRMKPLHKATRRQRPILRWTRQAHLPYQSLPLLELPSDAADAFCRDRNRRIPPRRSLLLL